MDAIYVVPISDRWLVHAPLHGISALVNTETVRALKNGNSSIGRVKKLSDALQQKPVYSPRSLTDPLNPDFLGIIPTRACNLNCVYCGFHADNSSHDCMDLSLAVSAVDWMAEHNRKNGRDRIDVHFFGGEPFCAPDVIDVVVHRTRALAAEFGLSARFEADTNGFFNESRCQFVGDYIDSVVLSFDGPEEVHNHHRPTKNGDGSFKIVAQNAYNLSKAPCELCFRVCVTQKNVKHLESITKWFSKNFHPSIIDFEPLKQTPQSDEAGLEPPDPWEFASYFMKAQFLSSRLGIKTVYSAASVNKVQNSSCPVGRDSLIVSPDGKVNACYLLEEEWKMKNIDLTMGHLKETGEMALDQTAIEHIRNFVTLKKRCQKCISRWHCAGGCHVNNFAANQTEDYDNFCIQTRIITIFMILQELGAHKDSRKLLHDDQILRKTALSGSDCLADWEG